VALSVFASGEGLHLEFFKCIPDLGRIDSENHPLSTMRGRHFLSTIEPEGVCGVGNKERSGYERLASSNELKSGVESIVEMSTRIIEGGLSDSMILRDKGEANLVTRFRINVGRVVGKSTILADGDVDDLSSRWRGGRRGESLRPEGVERMHLVLGVDGEHHAFAAVTGLSAVEPERFLGPDFDPYDPLFRMFRVDGLETRVKAVGSAVSIGQLGAWVVK